jgi:hypothetical protein
MADEVIVVFGAELDGYNAQIKSAIGANDKLEQSANDTSAQITKDFANSGKAIQQAFGGQQVSKSLDQTKKSAVELKAQIKALYDEEVRLLRISKNVATDGVGAVRKEAALLRSQLPGINGELGKTGTAIEQASKKSQSLTGQLRGLKQEISALESAGKGGSNAFTDLTIQAARLEDQIGDTRERVRVLASDTFKFDAAVGGIQAVAGAFAGAQSAIALFGGESEEVNKALLKVQASLGFVAAAQELANLATGQAPLKLALASAANELFATSLTGGAKALKIFSSALAVTGIGALVVAIGFAISILKDFFDATEKSSAGLRALQAQNIEFTRKIVEAQENLDLALGRISQRQADRSRDERKFAQEFTALQIANNKKLLDNEEALAAAKKLGFLSSVTGGLLASQATDQIIKLEQERVNIIKEAQKSEDLARKEFRLQRTAAEIEANKEDKDNATKAAIEKGKAVQAIERTFAEVNGQFILAASKKRFADVAVLEAELNVLRNKDSTEAQQELIDAKLKADLLGLELEYQQAKKTTEDLAALNAQYLANVKLAEQKAADESSALGKKEVKENKDNNKAKLEDDEEYAQTTISFAERIAAARAKSEKLTFDQSVQLTNELFTLTNELGNAKIAQLEENAAREIQLAGDDAQQKAGIERKLADEVAKIKRQQAIADKAQALFNIAISTAQAVAAATKLTVGAPAAIALAVAIGAIQAATVAARPIPKFEKGGLVKGPRHTQGGVIAELEGDEYITNRTATKRNRPLLEAINTGKEKEYIYKRFQVPIIQANQSAAINQKLNAKLDSARMERELQLNRKADSKNTNKIIKAVTNNKSPRYNWN